jgi:hypothetical protein
MNALREEIIKADSENNARRLLGTIRFPETSSEKPRKIDHLPVLKSMAAENGHTIWLIGALQDQKGFALERDRVKKLHNGILPYKTLIDLANIVPLLQTGKDNFISALIPMLHYDFEEILTLKYVNQAQKILLKEKMEAMIVSIQNALESASEEEILKWIQFLLGDGINKGFISQNDNWGSNANIIVESYVTKHGNNKNMITNKLLETRSKLIKFQDLKKIEDITEYLIRDDYENKDGISVVQLLARIHEGWRKDSLRIQNIKSSEGRSFELVHGAPNMIVRKEMEMIMNHLTHTTSSNEDLTNLVRDRIVYFRRTLEADENISAISTFNIMILLAEALSNAIKNLTPALKHRAPVLEAQLSEQIYAIKQDSNLAAFDAAIDYLSRVEPNENLNGNSSV